LFCRKCSVVDARRFDSPIEHLVAARGRVSQPEHDMTLPSLKRHRPATPIRVAVWLTFAIQADRAVHFENRGQLYYSAARFAFIRRFLKRFCPLKIIASDDPASGLLLAEHNPIECPSI